MGRHRSIDRDKVLDAAEAIVDEVGPGGLTIDAVAKAAGITKGGVQYCFGTKDHLIDALFDRWAAQYETRMNELMGRDNDPLTFVRSDVAMAKEFDRTQTARGAVMMAALMRSTERMEQTREWYRGKLAMLDRSTKAGQRTRLAFLAAEGACMLRCFGFMEINDEEWQVIVRDIESLLPPADTFNEQD